MLRVRLNAARSRVHATVIVLAVAVVCARFASADTLDALATWAEHTTAQPWQPGLLYTVPTSIEDHFGLVPYEAWGKRGQNGLGYPGLALPTAGVGSSWVYDPAHKIAAGTGYSDDGGWSDEISYTASPPSRSRHGISPASSQPAV
jgi:hypothetical protein